MRAGAGQATSAAPSPQSGLGRSPHEPPRPGLLTTAAGFRAIVLANRPGHPFLGNDFFRECGDVLSCHVIENPDMPSELQLLRAKADDLEAELAKEQAARSAADRWAVRPLRAVWAV